MIQPDTIAKDVECFTNHALIYKFMGLRVSLLFLEMWARKTWNPEGEMEVMLLANSYFMVCFSCMANRNRIFEGGPHFHNQIGVFYQALAHGF